MLARDGNMSQAQIASELGVHQTTISDDIKVLKQTAQRFIFDLAKGDPAYYYKTCIDSIEDAQSQAWKIFQQHDNNDFLNSTKLKLMALKVIIEANEAKFKLISYGPSVLAMKVLEERLANVEATAATITRQTV